MPKKKKKANYLDYVNPRNIFFVFIILVIVLFASCYIFVCCTGGPVGVKQTGAEEFPETIFGYNGQGSGAYLYEEDSIDLPGQMQNYVSCMLIDDVNNPAEPVAYLGSGIQPAEIIRVTNLTSNCVNKDNGAVGAVCDTDADCTSSEFCNIMESDSEQDSIVLDNNTIYLYSIKFCLIDTDNDFAYFIGQAPGRPARAYSRIVRVDIDPGSDDYFSADTMKYVDLNNTVLDLPVAGTKKAMYAVIDIVDQYIYAGIDNEEGRIARIDLSTFTDPSPVIELLKEDDLIAPSDSNEFTASYDSFNSAVLDINNDYVYFGGDYNNGTGAVLRINTADFSNTGISYLNTSLTGPLYAAAIDLDNNEAFFVSGDIPCQMNRIDLTNFTGPGAETSVQTINWGAVNSEYIWQKGLVDSGAGSERFLYFGTWQNTNAPKLIKMQIRDNLGASVFNLYDPFDLEVNDGGIWAFDLYDDYIFAGTYGWYNWSTTDERPARIIKLNKDWSSINAPGDPDNALQQLHLSPGENAIACVKVDDSSNTALNHYVYYVTDSDPVTVIRLIPTDTEENFARADSLVLGEKNTGTGTLKRIAEATTCVIDSTDLDPGKHYLYIGTDTIGDPVLGNVRRIAKVRIPDPDLPLTNPASKMEYVDFEEKAGSGYINSAIDPANEFAYFGNSGSNIDVVDLSNFSYYPDSITGLPVSWGPFSGDTIAIDTTNFCSSGPDMGKPCVISSNCKGTASSCVNDPDRGYLYFSGETGVPGMAGRINIEPARADFLDYVGGDDMTELSDPEIHGPMVVVSAIDRVNGYLYLGTWTNGATIFKLDIRDDLGSPLTCGKNLCQVDQITYNPGNEQRLVTGYVDPINDYAYFSTRDSPSYIIKVDTMDFEPFEAVKTTSTEIWAGDIDVELGYGYWGSRGYPGNAHKINLSLHDTVVGTTIDFAAGTCSHDSSPCDVRETTPCGTSNQCDADYDQVKITLDGYEPGTDGYADYNDGSQWMPLILEKINYNAINEDGELELAIYADEPDGFGGYNKRLVWQTNPDCPLVGQAYLDNNGGNYQALFPACDTSTDPYNFDQIPEPFSSEPINPDDSGRWNSVDINKGYVFDTQLNDVVPWIRSEDFGFDSADTSDEGRCRCEEDTRVCFTGPDAGNECEVDSDCAENALGFSVCAANNACFNRFPEHHTCPVGYERIGLNIYYVAFKTSSTQGLIGIDNSGDLQVGFLTHASPFDELIDESTEPTSPSPFLISVYGSPLVQAPTGSGTDFSQFIPDAPSEFDCQPDLELINWTFTDNADNETGFRLYEVINDAENELIFDTGPQIVSDLESLEETDLQINTLYENRAAAAYNGYGQSSLTDALSCYTLASVPTQPIIAETGDNSFTIALGREDDNPDYTEYALYESVSAQYISIQTINNNQYGVFADEAEWHTYEDWKGQQGIEIIGDEQDLAGFTMTLDSGQEYNFAAKARNGDGVETAFSVGTGGLIPSIPEEIPEDLISFTTPYLGVSIDDPFYGDNGQEVVPGTQFNYLITFSNQNGETATGVVVTDQLSQYLQYVDGSAVVYVGGQLIEDAVNLSDNLLTITLGDVETTEDVQIWFNVAVTEGSEGQTITNQAFITGDNIADLQTNQTSNLVTPAEFICGNGIIEGEEECDDGNIDNGDGCSAQCLLETEKTIIINAKPEKRVPRDGNFGLDTIIRFFLSDTEDEVLSREISTDAQGNAEFTDELADTIYDISLKGRSHLTKFIRGFDMTGLTEAVLDFTFDNSFNLLAGDVQFAKDDYINSLDLSAAAIKIFASDLDADLNNDGIVNSLDITIIIANIFKGGENL